MMRELVVVGGGPAGASVALLVARAGRDVVLMERERYPLDRLCGEVISPEAWQTLSALGATERLLAARPRLIKRAVITASSGAAWTGVLPGAALGLTRRTLDHALFEAARAAGADARDGVTVRSIVRDGDGYCLEVERKRRREFVRARQVVAACGRHSQLDRCLDNGRRRGDSAYVAFKYHATGVDCGDVVELHGFPGGYCGLSEVETGHVNVCAIVERDAFRAAGATVNAVQVGPMAGSAALRRHLASLRADGTPLTVGYIPFEVRGPVAGQVPLVGDAAAAIAPLCGDGIAMALRAGELLAPLLVAMLQGSLEREQMCRHYTSAWRGEFRRRLALGRLLQWLLMRSGAATVGLRAANALPWLARRLVLWTRGEIRDAVSPLQWDSVDGIGVP